MSADLIVTSVTNNGPNNAEFNTYDICIGLKQSGTNVYKRKIIINKHV